MRHEDYEAEAEAFRKATGFTAPGKDRSPVEGAQNENEREEAWRAWRAGRVYFSARLAAAEDRAGKLIVTLERMRGALEATMPLLAGWQSGRLFEQARTALSAPTSAGEALLRAAREYEPPLLMQMDKDDASELAGEIRLDRAHLLGRRRALVQAVLAYRAELQERGGG